MKLDEKVRAIDIELRSLAHVYGEYAVRRAVKRWSRAATMEKWRKRWTEERLLSSVWRPALRKETP